MSRCISGAGAADLAYWASPAGHLKLANLRWIYGHHDHRHSPAKALTSCQDLI